MRVPPTFREQYGPGSKLASWSVPILNPQRKEQIGEMPGELLHGLPHMLVLHKYVISFFVSFCFYYYVVLIFFRQVWQLQAIQACISMKDILYQSLENNFLF